MEPFSVMFWALGIVLAHRLQKVTQPAAWPGIPQQWYRHGTIGQGSVRFNLSEEVTPPPLSSLVVLSLCDQV